MLKYNEAAGMHINIPKKLSYLVISIDKSPEYELFDTIKHVKHIDNIDIRIETIRFLPVQYFLSITFSM